MKRLSRVIFIFELGYNFCIYRG